MVRLPGSTADPDVEDLTIELEWNCDERQTSSTIRRHAHLPSVIRSNTACGWAHLAAECAHRADWGPSSSSHGRPRLLRGAAGHPREGCFSGANLRKSGCAYDRHNRTWRCHHGRSRYRIDRLGGHRRQHLGGESNVPSCCRRAHLRKKQSKATTTAAWSHHARSSIKRIRTTRRRAPSQKIS